MLLGIHQCVRKDHTSWREDKNAFPIKYHEFAGNYHNIVDIEPYKFVYTGDEEYKGEIKLKMAPIPTGKAVVHYTDEEYAKHLIGNSISVPVLEHLLKPLAQLFAQREYPRFQYEYKWKQQQQQKATTSTGDESQSRASSLCLYR